MSDLERALLDGLAAIIADAMLRAERPARREAS
jgi:hypothetical protein